MYLECLDCGYDFESFEVVGKISDNDKSAIEFMCPDCNYINLCTFKEIVK